MRILVLFSGTYPGGMAMSKRLHLYAKGLIANGVELTICVVRATNTAVPTRSILVSDTVPYYYLLGPSTRTNHLLQKMQGIVDSVLLAKHLLLVANKFDAIWSIGFGWIDNFLIYRISKYFNRKVVVELNEKPYSMVGNRFDFKLVRLLKRIMFIQVVIKRFDGFVVISGALEDWITRRKCNHARVIRVPILVNLSDPKIPRVRETKFVFHAGTLNEKKDGIIAVFKGVVKAMKSSTTAFRFIITNRSALPSTLQEIHSIISSHRVAERIEFHNHISEAELAGYLSDATLAIVNRPYNDQNRHNFSTKLGEYWAAGIPVITTSVGEVHRYLKHRVNCLVIEPNDVDSIARNVLELVENDELAASIGSEGLKTAHEFFGYSAHASRIACFFQSVAQS